MLTVDFSRIPFRDGDFLLDLGCGEGRHAIGAAFDNPALNVIGVDLCFNDLQTAKNRHSEFDTRSFGQTLYTQGNGYQLPFADHSFDHVICSEVLEHIDDYQQMLAEMNRVLKPGGTLNVSVPRFWPEKICWKLSSAYHQVEGGHIRIFKSHDLKQDITDFRFDYHGRHWAHALHAPYWWLRCAFWKQGETYFPVRMYHKLLVWDLLKRPWITRKIEKLLNPVMGKSVVMYFSKPQGEQTS